MGEGSTAGSSKPREAIALAGQASAAGMAGILTGGCGIKLSGFHQWRKDMLHP